MALIGSFTKQPREKLPVDIDYTSVIAGRTVSSMTPTVETPSGMTLTSSAVSGETIQLYLSGGTDGVTYTWTVLMDIVIGGKTTTVEDEFTVTVEEVS
jgi:hypothetical protein